MNGSSCSLSSIFEHNQKHIYAERYVIFRSPYELFTHLLQYIFVDHSASCSPTDSDNSGDDMFQPSNEHKNEVEGEISVN